MAVIKEKIENQVFDEERALYNLKNTEVLNCTFAGKQDGESVLKETRNIKVVNSKFSLRYPLWHAKNYEIVNSAFDELTRAPIWYSENGTIDNCDFQGIKLLRECNNAQKKIAILFPLSLVGSAEILIFKIVKLYRNISF